MPHHFNDRFLEKFDSQKLTKHLLANRPRINIRRGYTQGNTVVSKHSSSKTIT